MPKLWLTYAWSDNDDQDVDHVIHELSRAGLDVRYDRVELIAGQRLWASLDAALNDPSVDAWAMYVTAKSLQSQPCQEEIAWVLDRALRSQEGFPLIGLFPAPIDRSLIPSALATRTYVFLTSPTWKEEIVGGVERINRRPSLVLPSPFVMEVLPNGKCWTIEVYPRTGRWLPCVAGIPSHQKNILINIFRHHRGMIFREGVQQITRTYNSPDFYGCVFNEPIDSSMSAQFSLRTLPTHILVGQYNSEKFIINIDDGIL